jgi:hypothetical protein
MAIATFYSDVAGPYDVARSGAGVITVPFRYVNVANVSFATIDDVLILVKLPKHSTLLAFQIDIPDLGTTGAADIGTLSDRDRFAAGTSIVSPIRASSAVATYAAVGSLPFHVLDVDAGDVTAQDDLRLTATAALSAWAAGTITGWAQYICNQSAAMAEVPVAVP